MVGRQILALLIMVRVHASEQISLQEIFNTYPDTYLVAY